ncbi:DsbE family thiol:disulfide interchange protein [Thiomicrorhabdus cannonii]|uniref:DsbE family thiol:disulfide interchange protein n=1 Tax=Thiomicrorhabdus cannonii TaxID=2748011 RepID=UPI0015B7C0C3|nr:DsbE family thiol:disulfide interchange protein [Thiomicrorhabdus cannonii]
MKKQWLPIAVFSLLVAFLAIGLTLNPKAVPSPLIGKPAPDFTLPLLNQQTAFSPQQLRGQVWLLNVWASWCSSCQQEHRLLVRFAQNRTLTMVGLNYKDTPNEAQAWLDALGNPYSFVVEDQNGQAGIDWGVYGVPETFVVDAAGIIRHKFTGPLTQQRLDNELLPLLNTLEMTQ